MNWRSLFRLLYALLFLFCGALFVFGRDYYLAPLAKKARHALNPVLRQSGAIGHLLAIIGVFSYASCAGSFFPDHFLPRVRGGVF